LDTAEKRKISSLLGIETQFTIVKKLILPPPVSLLHQHTLTKYDVHFQGRKSTIFLFFNPKLWVILPQKCILPCLPIDQRLIHTINQSINQSSTTEQSDDSIRKKSLLYFKNLPFSIFFLDAITHVKLNILGITHINP
jgi:hypothetical protein